MGSLKRFICALLVIAVMSLSPAVWAQEVQEGSRVVFDYTLSIDGQILETTKDGDPMEYVAGQGDIIPGLERALLGMAIGDEKTVVVDPKDGYGELLESGFREVPIANFPEDYDLKKGMVIEFDSKDGNVIPAIVWNLTDETVILNFNHPLAGKTLEFAVEIIDVQN